VPQTLPAFLVDRARRSLAYLLREAEAVTTEQALLGRRADWPDHPWGIGQDGSIAGIVYHVAAWKQLTLPILQPGGRSRGRADFDPSTAPRPDDWPALLAWLRSSGVEWAAALEALPDTEFHSTREWEDGAPITLAQFIAEMIDHDVQHAAQIEYLRQLYRIVL
jgi:hypothetical protein